MVYRPPGVTVQLQNTRGLTSDLGAADVLLLMGVADNFPLSASETVQLYGITPANLVATGIDDGSVVVTDSLGNTLVEGTDYDLSQTTDAFGVTTTSLVRAFAAVAAEDVTFTGPGDVAALTQQNLLGGSVVVEPDGGGTPYVEGVDYVIDYTNGTITHLVGGDIGDTDTVELDYEWATIANGETLTVSYQNAPEDLYEVHEWTDLQQAVNYYGEPMIGNAVNSPLSMSLMLISNSLLGAQLPRIKTLAVNPAGEVSSPAETVEAVDWLVALRDQIAGEDVTHLVPLTADTTVWGYVASFVGNQQSVGRYVRTFYGPDASINMLAAANGTPIFGYNSNRIVILDTQQVPWRGPTGDIMLIPGYYLAAVYAAQETTLPRATPMTHKALSGFERLVGAGIRSESQKNLLAQSGVTVVENRGLGLWVRHGKTTALTGPADEEPSITRVFDYMRQDLKASFEEKFIGTGFFVDEPTKFAIEAEAENRLSQYVSEGTILGFGQPTVNVGTDPRTFEVHAQVDPRFPLNNLDFFLLVNA